MGKTSIEVREREIIGTRIYDAPRELVWRAFTDPQHLARWWGPNGFTNSFHEFDFRPGGTWRHVMHGPDGTDYPNESRFVEIAWLQRLVIDHISAPKFRLTVSLEDAGAQSGSKTKLVFHQFFESVEAFESIKPYALPGLEQNLEKLAEHLPTIDLMRRELTIRRTFNAPRALVWEAWTDPKHLAQWWGPEGFTNPVCEVDLRVGGELRIVMRGPDGTDYPMRGTFREIAAPERLVFISGPVDKNDRFLIDGLTTVTLAERGGKTEMVLETRAIGLVASAVRMIAGMDLGWLQSIDRLADNVEGALSKA
ncbi:MAG TPA: SRPBCC domain-containing protein [Methylovirgula sp.]|nr:SRPBCC domain-containing protein [Methylovirgula sp.]